MKKTLFSLAFVAASGAYVATANHMFEQHPQSGLDVATAAPLLLEKPAVAVVPAPAPAAPPALPLVVAPPAPAPKSPPIVAEIQAAPLPNLPPLPRPRPSPPATLAVRSATSTTVADATAGGYRDGTYTGSNENAYYGRVQVQITVAGHQIAAVKVLDYPQDRRTSRYINSQALPLLKQEAIAATDANIDMVSGATLTSRAYIRSLANALRQAGGGNA